MIRAERLSKSFGKRIVLRDVSFEVNRGEILGLLGPNGAGKTTTIRILAGFFPPTSGHVVLDGRDLFESGSRIRSRIGYLPENVPLYSQLTTEEFLNFVAECKGIPPREKSEQIELVVNGCGLQSARRRLAGTLSKGFRQRIGLAQALLGNPSVLILDEPTVGLDPRQIMEVRSLIKEFARERTVILSTHILPEVSMLCSRVLIMDQGVLVASGTPSELAEKIRHSAELAVTVRGEAVGLEDAFGKIPGIIAVRRVPFQNAEQEFRIRFRKGRDIRPAVSKLVVDSGFELLGIKELSVSMEEIFLRIVVHEEGVSSP